MILTVNSWDEISGETRSRKIDIGWENNIGTRTAEETAKLVDLTLERLEQSNETLDESGYTLIKAGGNEYLGAGWFEDESGNPSILIWVEAK